MSTLIRNRAIEADGWLSLADDAALPGAGQVLVSLARWQAGVAPSAGLAVGVRLPNTADVDALWPTIASAAAIELDFPKVGDGRAYSQARILRGRLGFTGELRAAGDGVVLDHVFFLQRCGVNAMRLRADQKPAACLQALESHSTAYQPAADDVAWILQRRRQGRGAVTKA